MATRISVWISGGLAALFLILTGWLWFSSPGFEIRSIEDESHSVTCPPLTGTSTFDDLSVSSNDLHEATNAFIGSISGAEDQVGDTTTPLYESTQDSILAACDNARDNRQTAVILSGVAAAAAMIMLGNSIIRPQRST